MKVHTALSILSIAALAALGIYGHLDVQWALVAICTGHGVAQTVSQPR